MQQTTLTTTSIMFSNNSIFITINKKQLFTSENKSPPNKLFVITKNNFKGINNSYWYLPIIAEKYFYERPNF